MKVSVTMRSVIQRINRRLKPDREQLKTTRGERLRMEVGDYYVINYAKNFIAYKDVDPEQLGRELGVLKEWEQVVGA